LDLEDMIININEGITIYKIMAGSVENSKVIAYTNPKLKLS